MSSKKNIQQTSSSGTYEMIKTIFFAAMIAIAIRSLAYEPFSIPSRSMLPTLKVGDYLFVSKSSYGYSRYSFPLGLVPIHGRLGMHMPKQGDVAVFRKPTNDKIDYIKRVIGLPGDVVEMRKGRLYINNEMVQRHYLGDYKAKMVDDGDVLTFKRYREELPNGLSHEIIELSDSGGLDNTPPVTVPEGHYFMMGDNRDGSQDSRVMTEVGFVPIENFIGRAERIFFSVHEDSRIWELNKYPTSLQKDRFFKEIK